MTTLATADVHLIRCYWTTE